MALHISPNAGAGAASPSLLLVPPADGVVVRMYRIGHGDCFLLAFRGNTAQRPVVYVLIDCGYKPGSPKCLETTAAEVGASIREATGGHIDVAIITHEHQDHVNGITEANFAGITVGEAWFAWTEDPEDELANSLRKRFNDRLQLLLQARMQLAAAPAATVPVAHIDDFLAFELGGDDKIDFSATAAIAMMGATGDASGSQNKRAMSLIKTRAQNGIRYLRPHGKALGLTGADHVRVFPMGPPRDEALLHSLDPVGDEGFRSLAFGPGTPEAYFASAVGAGDLPQGSPSPFAPRYWSARDPALGSTAGIDFWNRHYGSAPAVPTALQAAAADGDGDGDEVEDNPEWRRIDQDWLYSAEQMALDMNNDTNNGSLVLAFELGTGGKVLLFAADAQRGNWVSWSRDGWTDGQRGVSAQDLLARTVLYKVGHHGSHNATLDGKPDSKYPNITWMAQGEWAHEFTAMITAVRPWAETQKGWDHPQAAIKDALLAKTAGRVFQTDTRVADMTARGSASDWAAFQARLRDDRLFIDYTITP